MWRVSCALADRCGVDAVTMTVFFVLVALVLLFIMVIFPDVERVHYEGDFGKKDSGLVSWDDLTAEQKDDLWSL